MQTATYYKTFINADTGEVEVKTYPNLPGDPAQQAYYGAKGMTTIDPRSIVPVEPTEPPPEWYCVMEGCPHQAEGLGFTAKAGLEAHALQVHDSDVAFDEDEYFFVDHVDAPLAPVKPPRTKPADKTAAKPKAGSEAAKVAALPGGIAVLQPIESAASQSAATPDVGFAD